MLDVALRYVRIDTHNDEESTIRQCHIKSLTNRAGRSGIIANGGCDRWIWESGRKQWKQTKSLIHCLASESYVALNMSRGYDRKFVRGFYATNGHVRRSIRPWLQECVRCNILNGNKILIFFLHGDNYVVKDHYRPSCENAPTRTWTSLVTWVPELLLHFNLGIDVSELFLRLYFSKASRIWMNL